GALAWVAEAWWLTGTRPAAPPGRRRAGSGRLHGDPSVVDHPLHHQQGHGQDEDPLPDLLRLRPLLAGDDVVRADADFVARLDVALVAVEQVDGEAAVRPRPRGLVLVDAEPVGVAEDE